MIPKEDAIWLAGLLEGEGSFNFRTHSPYIHLGMTDGDVVEHAARVMGVTARPQGIRPGRKQVWVACACGQRALDAMAAIRPFMGARRGLKIDEVVAAASARPGTPIGERHPRAKLNEQAIILLRHLAKRGVSGRRLARAIEVSPTTAYRAINGQSWSHVTFGLSSS